MNAMREMRCELGLEKLNLGATRTRIQVEKWELIEV